MRLTTRLEGRAALAAVVVVALVKVNVKYWVSSILQIEMIQEAWKARFCECFLSFLVTTPRGPRDSGEMTTSIETSCTVVRAKFVVLKGGNGGFGGEAVWSFGVGAVGVVLPLSVGSSSSSVLFV